MLKNRFRDYRDIGGEYLNYQFGWKPIVSDVKKVAKAVSDSERILTQLQRDSGKTVRRRFKFPPVLSTKTSVGTGRPYPALNSTSYYSDMTRQVIDTVEQRKWFSGAFTYHFEMSDSQMGRLRDQARNARVLLGLDLNPSVLWNLSPWSWLADWVSNAGDVLSNVSTFSHDGLVMRYGYIMETTMETRSVLYSGGTYYNQPNGNGGNVYPLPNVSGVFTRTTKQRLPATPFGFGLTSDGFDPRQWAILGALGISRGPGA